MSPRNLFSVSGLFDGKPVGLSWRSHYWYTTVGSVISFAIQALYSSRYSLQTIVIGFGISTDILIYSLLIPVLPFRLDRLGYEGVPALVGYMLFAFSGGLVISTLPIAWHSERFSSRRAPLNVGLILMIGCQFMLMFAPTYWLMILARVLQGIASSMVWIVGLALLCDMSPPEHVGRQLGFVLSGFSFGLLLGPTVGGALYDRFGWNGPLIFGIIFLVVDLIGRLLIIDRDEALKYGVDPRTPNAPNQASSDEKRDAEANTSKQEIVGVREQNTSANNEETVPKKLSLLSVIILMGKSPKALAPLACAFIYGLLLSMEETAVPLHLRDVWKINSTKIGLTFLAGAIPPLFGAPLVGWLSDKWGTEWTLPMSMLLAVPWWCVLIIEKSLALFIVAAALQMFFTSSVSPPIMTELASASDNIDGVGYAHVYGAFNLIYGVGSAVGPLIGGQIYEHSSEGWLIICIIGAATMLAAAVLTGCLSGNTPLLMRFKAKSGKKEQVDATMKT